DGAPLNAFVGSVVAVGERAEFAPSDMATTEPELLKVVKVTLEVENKKGVLKAGMPADVMIYKTR
ncbi:MAG: efflux RND transporter periplasmic adaptor subunit, partial [Rubrobacteridae bacterium]|nr:efflux RND transporter periplasmic adaptor subunit [Rubrobacteridae bacterium]